MNNKKDRLIIENTCFFGSISARSQSNKGCGYSLNTLGKFARLDQYELAILTKSDRSIFGRCTDFLLLDPVVNLMNRMITESLKQQKLSHVEKEISMRKILAALHVALIALCSYCSYSTFQQLNFYGLEYVFIETVTPTILVYLLSLTIGIFVLMSGYSK